MSRHLDAVATSTLHLKQLRHHLKRRSCRDNIKMSQQQLYRDEVATTSGCRDNSCTEKLSRQHQDVATTIVEKEVATTPGCRDNSCKDQNVATSISCRDVGFNEKRSRQEKAVATPPSLKTCRNNTEAPATRIATRPATRTAKRTDVVMRALCRDNISLLGQFTKVQKRNASKLGPNFRTL